jgi:hypothetical protein
MALYSSFLLLGKAPWWIWVVPSIPVAILHFPLDLPLWALFLLLSTGQLLLVCFWATAGKLGKKPPPPGLRPLALAKSNFLSVNGDVSVLMPVQFEKPAEEVATAKPSEEVAVAPAEQPKGEEPHRLGRHWEMETWP